MACRRGVCESLKDGRVLLKVLDRLSPGCVDWRSVRSVPSRPLLKRPVSIETCNQVPLSVQPSSLRAFFLRSSD